MSQNGYKMDDDKENYNTIRLIAITERLIQAADGFEDRIATALDHVLTARDSVRNCIDAVNEARVANSALSGRALDDHCDELLDIERELSCSEGELS